jgi:hypothetical protein
MKRSVWMARIGAGAALAAAIACGGGGGGSSNAPTCDDACQDGDAMVALRDAIKLVYNVTLQGKPVGPQDQIAPCPLGGTAHVHGTAESNASQGTTSVSLTYDFAGCHFSQVSTANAATQSFDLTLTGSVTEQGTIAVQPSSTTSLTFDSDSMTIAGTVSSPSIDYSAQACMVQLGQNGNNLSGSLCGRSAGVTL